LYLRNCYVYADAGKARQPIAAFWDSSAESVGAGQAAYTSSKTHYIEQRSSAVFFQNSSAGELFSVLDYSKKFIWIKLESEVELQKLTLQIGQRTFEILPAQLVRGECRLLGSQLPEIR
jgi:hypothetical protein